MKRNEFIKGLCSMGVCSCASMALYATGSARAEEKPSEDIETLKWKMDFMRKRFAKLVGLLDANLDEPTRHKIFESLGRECAKMFTNITGPYVGRPEAFLEEIKRRWAKETEYDARTGRIRVTDKSDHCTCALVDEALTPSSFCHCTLGWQKETYSMIVGKPVDAELEESVLRGGKRCVFRVQVSNSKV